MEVENDTTVQSKIIYRIANPTKIPANVRAVERTTAHKMDV